MDAARVPIDLADAQQVFLQCVREALEAVPGLRHELVYDPRGAAAGRAYAIFDLRVNPAHDLTVALELASERFVVRVNGVPFITEGGGPDRTERWIHRCCRLVERLVGDGRLRLRRHMTLIAEASMVLESHCGGKWRRIGTRSNAVIALLGLILPLGPITHQHVVEYENWWAGGERRPDAAEDG